MTMSLVILWVFVRYFFVRSGYDYLFFFLSFFFFEQNFDRKHVEIFSWANAHSVLVKIPYTQPDRLYNDHDCRQISKRFGVDSDLVTRYRHHSSCKHIGKDPFRWNISFNLSNQISIKNITQNTYRIAWPRNQSGKMKK